MLDWTRKRSKYLVETKYLPLLLFVLIATTSSVQFSELFNPTQSGVFIYFSIGILLVFASYLIYKIFIKSSYTITLNVIDLSLLMIFVFITLNRYLFHQTYGFSLRFYSLLSLSLLYIIIKNIEFKHSTYLLLAIVTAVLIQDIHGSLQLLGYLPSHNLGFRLTGNFFNPGPYAGFLSCGFPVALGLYDQFNKCNKLGSDSGYKLRIISALCLCTMVLTLFLLPISESRAAWLALSCGSLYIIFSKSRYRLYITRFLRRSGRKFILIAFLCLAILLAGKSLYSIREKSVDGRILIWKITGNIIADYPLMGLGYDRFEAHFMSYQAEYFKKNPGETENILIADNVSYSYNEFIQFASENGVPACLALLATLTYMLASKKNSNKHNSIITISKAGLITITIFSLFSYPTHILPTMINATCFAAIISNAIKDHVYRMEFKVNSIIRYSILTVLFTATILISGRLKKIYEGYWSWDEAEKLFLNSHYQAANRSLAHAIQLIPNEGHLLQQSAKSLINSGDISLAMKQLNEAEKFYVDATSHIAIGECFERMGNYDSAITFYKSACLMIPNRVYPQYLLAKLYLTMGNTSQAFSTAKSILKMEAKVSSKAVDDIKAEMKEILNNQD